MRPGYSGSLPLDSPAVFVSCRHVPGYLSNEDDPVVLPFIVAISALIGTGQTVALHYPALYRRRWIAAEQCKMPYAGRAWFYVDGHGERAGAV